MLWLITFRRLALILLLMSSRTNAGGKFPYARPRFADHFAAFQDFGDYAADIDISAPASRTLALLLHFTTSE